MDMRGDASGWIFDRSWPRVFILTTTRRFALGSGLLLTVDFPHVEEKRKPFLWLTMRLSLLITFALALQGISQSLQSYDSFMSPRRRLASALTQQRLPVFSFLPHSFHNILFSRKKESLVPTRQTRC